MPATIAITDEVRSVLRSAETNGHELRLVGQLDRTAYAAVNKVLVAAGGKWDRRAGAHLFLGDAADVVASLSEQKTVTNQKQALGVFLTPPAVVDLVAAAADIAPGERVLEPSVGTGRLAAAAIAAGAIVVGYELRLDAELVTEAAGTVVHRGVDFLDMVPDPTFDAVVMNPPFAKRADIAHVTHALRFLRPGGRLVAVMSPAFLTGRTRDAAAFRALIDGRAEVDELPAGSFRESGTDVRTVLVTIEAD